MFGAGPLFYLLLFERKTIRKAGGWGPCVPMPPLCLTEGRRGTLEGAGRTFFVLSHFKMWPVALEAKRESCICKQVHHVRLLGWTYRSGKLVLTVD